MSYQGTYADYEVKQARYDKVLAHEPVDIIPCVYMANAFAPRHMGLSIHEFCTDADKALAVSIESMQTIGDFDGVNIMQCGYITMLLSSIWLSKVRIPGIDLPPDDLWQVQEIETAGVDAYDFIVDKGWEAFVESTLPKVVDLDLWAQHVAWMEKNFTGVADKYRNAGFMAAASALGTIPFEPLCGVRSMSKFYMDLYRMPDKVKAAMDVIAPSLIAGTIGAAKASSVNGVWVGGWRSASAMIAPDIWDKLVWPYFRDMALALIEEGITPVFHWDQNWDRDLERLLELPAKKCVLNPDGMTDIRLAKKILKGHTALMGDVPSQLFAAGEPEDVRAYVRDLVRDVGPEGLILCPGCDAPINTKVENMQAFLDSSREFGQGA